MKPLLTYKMLLSILLHSASILSLKTSRRPAPGSRHMFRRRMHKDSMDYVESNLADYQPKQFRLMGLTYCDAMSCPLPHQELYSGDEISFESPSSHNVLLEWSETPTRVLFLAKPDPEIYVQIRTALLKLFDRNLDVVVEDSLMDFLASHDVEHGLQSVLVEAQENHRRKNSQQGQLGQLGQLEQQCNQSSNETVPSRQTINERTRSIISSGGSAAAAGVVQSAEAGHSQRSQHKQINDDSDGNSMLNSTSTDSKDELFRRGQKSSSINMQTTEQQQQQHQPKGTHEHKSKPSPTLHRFVKGSKVDFIITFGGDGLLLHCNTLFDGLPVPPIMGFDFGSLGFLCPFKFEDFATELDWVLKGSEILLTLRMRLECTIWRNNVPNGTYCVLNEAVMDRGPSPYLSVLDLNCNSQYITTLQGDGIIFATPTGSTAYSLAAGGPVVYPSVPAILLTPICAHSLSFRPMLLPDTAVLTCVVPEDSRSTGWVSFDGKFRQELVAGDWLEVRMSPYPLPTVNRKSYAGDWLDALRAGFMYNIRRRQKGKDGTTI